MWTATAKFRRCQTPMCRVPLEPGTLSVYSQQCVKYYCNKCLAKLGSPFVLYRNPQVTFFLDYCLTQGTYFQLLDDPCLRRYLFEFTSTKPIPRALPAYITWQYFVCRCHSHDFASSLKKRGSYSSYADYACIKCHILIHCSRTNFCLYCDELYAHVESYWCPTVTIKYPDRVY